jgi:transcriptional regulator with GAF, ATPase, and Fis domain
MRERLDYIPDPELEHLGKLLAERLAMIAGELQPAQFRAWAAPLLHDVLSLTFRAAGASEGTLWVVDVARENLVPVYNDGPESERFLKSVTHPLSSGLVSMVFATQETFCENEVYKNEQHAKAIERQLGQMTCAMIAVPLFFAQDVRGVISCVRVKSRDSSAPDPPGFSVEDLGRIELAAETAERLIEHRLIAKCLGWDHGG